MKCPAFVTRWSYLGIVPLAGCVSRLLPARLHPGKRAWRAVEGLRLSAQEHVSGPAAAATGAPASRNALDAAFEFSRGGGAGFARAVLESALRTMLLHHHVRHLSEYRLAWFIEHCVEYDDAAVAPQALIEEPRPLLFAIPHYGALTAACAAGARLMHGRRAFNVFYDRQRHGAQLESFFLRAGIPAARLLDGSKGVRSALRALERGECLAILPDGFEELQQTLVVPFFNRLLRVAAGTAHLARRSRALIVPVFAAPRRAFGLRLTFTAPIDPCRLGGQAAGGGAANGLPCDERQAVFVLTRLLFARIEAQLRRAPEHWYGWERLPHVSTPLALPGEFDDAALLRAIGAKFRSLPSALQDIPELEFLLS